jgi:hypothetical protein
MLLAGELDAAILADPAAHPALRPVIPEPVAAARRWREKHGARMINHVVVVKRALPRDVADEVYRLLRASRAAAGDPELCPFGFAENQRNFEVAVECAHRQGLIPRRFSAEELCQ